MKASLAFVLVSLLAVGYARFIDEDQYESRSLVDNIIRGVLEGIRPKLANLSIPDINETVSGPSFKVAVVAQNITVKNADKFVIKTLKSNMVPLKLANLTLTLDNVVATAFYDVNAMINVPQLKDPVKIFAKGNGKVSLSGLYFTIGANLEMKDGKIQIKHRGLFGFDVDIKRANVTLESFMGSQELGQKAGAFLSTALPKFVNDFKHQVFYGFQDQIIDYLNKQLRGQKSMIGNDEFELPESILEDEAFHFEGLPIEENENLFNF